MNGSFTSPTASSRCDAVCPVAGLGEVRVDEVMKVSGISGKSCRAFSRHKVAASI